MPLSSNHSAIKNPDRHTNLIEKELEQGNYDFPKNTSMHILIVPSEEFLPKKDSVDGIFQFHQAEILQKGGYKVGILSICLSFSLPMIFKGLVYKLRNKRTGRVTDNYSSIELLKIGFLKLFKPGYFIKKDKLWGLNIYRIEGLYFWPPADFKNHYSWVKAGMKCFKTYMKDHGMPDLIHAHNAVYAGMLADAILEKFHVKYIITEHSSMYALEKSDVSVLKRVERVYNRAENVYAVSNSFKSYLNNLFPTVDVKYLPNVIDPRLEETVQNASRNENTVFKFLHIGRLLSVKNQVLLLEAFKIAFDKLENIKLIIGGGGVLEAELKKRAQQLNLAEAVEFRGLLSREAVASAYEECNCFVLSSHYETFGVVLIEALLFGKPLVTTDCGVSRELVDETNGYLVETADAFHLAEAMIKVVREYQKYQPDQIREKVIREFGQREFLKKIINIYNEAISHE